MAFFETGARWRQSRRGVAVALAVALCGAAVGGAADAQAQDVPWCDPDGLAPSGDPLPPRPYWGQLQGIPDYGDVMNNFTVSKSIRLLASVMEKSLALLTNPTSEFGSDADGWCICHCDKNAEQWVSYISSTLKNNLEAAVLAAKNDYVDALTAKLEALKQVVLDTLPNFKSDLETAIQNACNTATGTECDLSDPGATLLGVAQNLGTIALNEIESIFDAEKDQVIELLTGAGSPYAEGMEAIQAQLDAVVAALPDILKFDFSTLSQELSTLFDIVGDIIGDVLDGAKAIAQSYTTGDVLAWKAQVVAAVQAQLATHFADANAAWSQLEADVEAAVQARIDAIKAAIDDVFVTALNYQGPFDTFKSSFLSGVGADLTNVGGCYGQTKRGQCSLDPGGFCEGTPAGPMTILGIEIETPLWFPTEVFKDGKTALLFALKHIGFLEKVVDFLNSAAPGWMQTAGSWIDALKNAAEILDKIAEYVNTFTDGFHLGAYSDIRPDLHMCVGYAGHGALAQVFSFDIGNNTVSGGASYASFNLSKKHRAQFRSGGFAVDVNGKTLQLAPGISLNTQFDGWRMWDKFYPFGLGRNADGSFWNAIDPTNWTFSTSDVEKIDIFNLVDVAAVTDICGGATCTPTSFLYTGYFPVDYVASGTAYLWPREAPEWEQDHAAIAVFGAGLNLDFEMKTYRWDITPSILLFPVPPVWLTPWLSLDAGVGWKYEANFLRDTLQDKLNQNLPSSAQLSVNDFRRDKFPYSSPIFNGEPFQAPDVTEDMGTAAFVRPSVGADLDIGIKIAKFLQIGITASIYLGIDVSVGGYGGVLDLNRALVDALAMSNPPGDDCNVVIDEQVEHYCTSDLHKPNSDNPCASDPDCIDQSQGGPNQQGPFSTGTYKCGEGEGKVCADYGYCRRIDGSIMAHDVTREQCEGPDEDPPPAGKCSAQYIVNPCQCGIELCVADVKNVMFGPPWGFCHDEIGQAHLQESLSLANAQAQFLTDPEQCMHMGWCYHYVQMEGQADTDTGGYMAYFTGIAASPDECPPPVWPSGEPILGPDGGPVTSQWVKFQWEDNPNAGGGADGGMGGDWFPYQCATRVTPVVTGWTGPDCNPIEFGYPSACSCFDDANCGGNCNSGTCSEAPSAGCSCNPTGGATCPSGRTCVEGACVLTCGTDADCGPHLACVDGGCQMANGVPFAETILWQMRNVSEPMHAVASYALNRLVVSAILGAGVTIGARYRIFKKWREKKLFEWKDTFPLLELPFVKHQLGLEAQYQDDCPVGVGAMTNHQPGQVTRPSGLPNGTPSSELAEWCKPSMENNVTNPPSPDDPSDVIGQGLEDVHNFGYDLGLDLWYRNQMCIDGVVWYEYFAMLHEDPAMIWGLLECTYYGPDGVHGLNCDSPQELLGNLLTALGCLDATGSSQNQLLAVLIQNAGLAGTYLYTYTPMVDGVATGPSRTVLDWYALFLDMEDLLVPGNVSPTVVGFNGQKPLGIFGPTFWVSQWLAQLDQCMSDIEDGGTYVDDNLLLELAIGEEDFGPCSPCDGPNPDEELCPRLGACCTPSGACLDSQFSTCAQLGGSWQAGQSCANTTCASNPSTGACCTGSGCVPVSGADACAQLGGAYQAGASCADVHGCEGQWACCTATGCQSLTAGACQQKQGTFFAGQTCGQIGECGQPAGACCRPDGICSTLTQSGCAAVGGSFSATGSCDVPGFCSGGATGACCLPTGCAQTSATECQAAIAQAGAGTFTFGASCQQVGCDQLIDCCLPTGECASLPKVICAQSGGQLTDQCVPGQSCFGGGTLHACCLPTGQCSNLTQGQCVAAGGSVSLGVLCSPGTACIEQPFGACCLPSGECAELTVLQCELAGGTGFQQGATCANTALQCGGTDVMACCMPKGQCLEIPGQECLAIGGSPKPGESCATSGLCISAQTPWACCLPKIGCQSLPTASCKELGGISHIGKHCGQVLCSVEIQTGACCLDGQCTQTTSVRCAANGGLFHAGKACAEVNCRPQFGACCLGDECFMTTAQKCKKAQWVKGVSGGFYPGMHCDDVQCGNIGACCTPSGDCMQTTKLKCALANGEFTPGVSCDAVDCCEPPPLGACCVQAHCYELPEDHCLALSGAWQPELTCDQASCCAQQPATVACCLAAGCFELTPAACSAMGGSAGGPGTSCAGLSAKACLIALPADPVLLEKEPITSEPAPQTVEPVAAEPVPSTPKLP